jgi:hypothetical protein
MHSRLKSIFVGRYGAIISARIKAQKKYSAGFTLIKEYCIIEI